MHPALQAEKMLFVAPLVGIDPVELERIQYRLASNAEQHRRTWPSRRSVELEELIERDKEVLAQAFKRLEGVVARMPSS